MNKIVYIIIMMGVFAAIPQILFSYEAGGKRDPFIPLIGQEKVKSSGLENITSIEDVALEGMAVGAGNKNIAILNGQMVKEGDKFGTLIIKKISNKQVDLSIEGKNYKLDFQEEEGIKVGKE